MEIRIFEVGGSLRNELLGIPSKDRDFAVIAPDYFVMRNYLLDRGAIIYQERPEYVSLKARLEPLGAVDFTLARKESFYTDARHPNSVSVVQSIEEDLARRDHRMNAIAREVGSSVLIDPFDGQRDIKEKVIRCVGNPINRFKEDRIRIFRCIRFSCQLDFVIDQEVSDAIDIFNNIDDFKSISKEMVQIELFKAFKSDWRKCMSILNRHVFLYDLIEFNQIWLKPTLEER